MENASKALYMTAGIIIGLLVLSLLVFAFRAGAKAMENVEDRKEAESIQAYNARLAIYARPGTEDDFNTYHDILSAYYLAQDINDERNKYTTSLTVLMNGSPVSEDEILYLIKSENGGYATDDSHKYIKKFSGTVKYDDKTGKIYEIDFNSH